MHTPALGTHVRSFCFSQVNDGLALVGAGARGLGHGHGHGPGGSGRLVLGHAFWVAVHSALGTMKGLEYLVLYDASFANSWVLDAVGAEGGGAEEEEEKGLSGCGVIETKLRFRWDEHVVKFLERQKKLAMVQVQAPEYGVAMQQSLHHSQGRLGGLLELPLATGSLPVLRIFDGTLGAGLEVVRAGAPVTNLQVVVNREAMDAGDEVDSCEGLEEDVRMFAKVGKTLKSLNLIDVPEEMVGKVVSVLAAVCPGLVYLGLLPLPVLNVSFFFVIIHVLLLSYIFQRQQLTYALMSLRSLRHVHLDISKWLPHPHTGAQRALAAEMKVYCPSIRHVSFWYHSTRFRWHYSQEQWNPQVDNHQHPQLDQTWSLI